MKYPFTKAPNWFFDILPDLTDCELRILLVIMRKTYGWSRLSDKISYSQLIEQSGLKTRSSVSKGLKGLADRGLIEKNPRTVTAQEITIVPIESTISASVLVHKIDSESPKYEPVLVHKIDSESPKYEPALVQKIDSQKTGFKETLKDNNKKPDLSETQLQARLLLLSLGLLEPVATDLVLLAWTNGRDISYISLVTGYVAQHGKTNLPGLARHLIEKDLYPDVPPQALPGAPGGPNPFEGTKYAHGGKYHYMAELTCPICHPGKEVEEVEE